MTHKPTPLHLALAGIVGGAEKLSTTTRSWSVFLPRPAALDEAILAADALARGLRELRRELHREAKTTNPQRAG